MSAIDPSPEPRAERLQNLHAASLRLFGLLTAQQPETSLLQQAIESLAELIGARYGAIGVLDEAGQLKQFVYTGLTPEEAARIGRLPEGKGLLGVVIHENHVLRLDDMARDPRAVGLPFHHPPMKSLLAVPVSHDGRVYGRVYLSEKKDGAPFTAEDEQLVTRFAEALALTIRFHRAETERLAMQDVLQNVAHAVSAVTGQAFFQTLVLDLAKALNADYAFVGKLAGGRRDAVETVAVNAKGRIADNFTYELKGTPCLNIVGKEPCQYPRGVQQQFPDDRLLKEMGVESYVGCPLFGASGKPLGLLAVMDSKPMHDPLAMSAVLQICTARASAELERIESDAERHKLSSAVEQTADSVLITDAEGVIQYVNPAYERTTGYARAEAIGNKPSLVKSGHHDAAFYERLWSAILRGEVFRDVLVNRRKNGELYYEEKTISPLKNERGEITHFVSTGKDITERKRAEEQLNYLAYYDTLTGLPNRVLLLERLRQAMVDAERVDRLVAVMFLDLDRFKYINDTLGHHVGDGLLKAVAERLKECVRPGDTIARLGGDEFTIVLANVARVDDVARVARKLIDSFARPFQVEGHELFTTTSIGITLYPFDERDAEGLLKNADTAMYHAKERGRNTFQYFTAELNVRAERRLRIETALRQALERNELSLHYQPQVDLKSGRLTGMEALARWHHPELGSVSPVEFIPVAEETGLILPIGEWVLREACRQIKTWHGSRTSFSKMQVAVNISGKQLRQKDFPDLVRQVLEDTGLEARYLDLELTESLLMEDVEETADIMHTLHDLGVSFSVDDFGTGYSSLSYLKRFPIDVLKIDRSFVRDIASDPNDVAIVKTIIAMAHTLGMRVIAEGVETRDQLEFLRAQGCDGSQGYYCSMPLSAAEFSELLADWKHIRANRCEFARKVLRSSRQRRPVKTKSRGRAQRKRTAT